MFRFLITASLMGLAAALYSTIRRIDKLMTQEEELQAEIAGLKNDVATEKAQVASKVQSLDARILALEEQLANNPDVDLSEEIAELKAIRVDTRDIAPDAEVPPIEP